MGDLLGSFPETVRVGTKHAEKTHVDLWGQSAILKRLLLGLSIDPTNQHESF